MKYFVTSISQKKRFAGLRNNFQATYKQLKALGKEPFVMPFWSSVNKKVEAVFIPTVKSDFLGNRAIKDTMFVAGDENWLNIQVDYLKSRLGSKFKKLTREDAIGKPALLGGSLFFTSHNTIHHLYHILFYLEQTNQKVSDVSSVVEWGGGYGNFTKLWWRLRGSEVTYTILDTALFCSIQWLYLSSVFGPSKVNLIVSSHGKIQKNKINLVPVALMDKIKIEGDLFVSTWGLSESMSSAQDYVVKKRNWFGANHYLIGYQDSTKDLKYASRLGEIAKQDGAKIVDIKFIPNNHYALK